MSATVDRGDSLTTEPKQPDRSLGELFGDLGREFNTLVHQELELAKTEAKQEIRKASHAGVALGVAGAAAWLGAVMASFAVAWLLDQAMNRALAFLIVAVMWLIVAGIEASMGRRRLKVVGSLSETKQSIKEDASWAKQQLG